jgi:large subunit ribosomal protein L13
MNSQNPIIVHSKELELLQLEPKVVEHILKTREILIDAENSVLGRLATHVAKLAMLGFKVHVINVEKAVVSGDKKTIVDSYKLLLEVKTHKNPYRHAIHRPRHPINIFKKSVKLMLPKHCRSRFKILKNVKAYIGVPQEFKDKPIIKILDCDASYLKRRKIVPVSVIAKELGWKGVVKP